MSEVVGAIADGSLMRVLAMISATVPPFVIVLYFLVATRLPWDDERIWTAFGFGVLAVFPAMVIELLAVGKTQGSSDGSLGLVRTAFLLVALPEEGMKLLVVLMACGGRLREMDPRRLFVTAIAAGGGFAFLENVFYVVGQSDWATMAILRSISAVPGHVFVGAVMGLCLIKASRGPQRLLWWGTAPVLPVALHGAYDYYLFEISNASTRMEARDMANFFALAFVVIMLIEAALAHFGLIALMRGDMGRSREQRMAVSGRAGAGYRLPSRSQRPSWSRRGLNAVMPHRLTWAVLGSLWLAAGALLLWQALTGQGLAAEMQNMAFELGIAAIAGVHAVAFFALVVIPRCGNRILP